MSATGCGCGGCGGTKLVGVDATRDGAFARPEFFAGQLLTDRDLDDLTAYVRGKNRLHNRYLHGAGVVCGLDVTAAGERAVLVTAGYALDCCGEDIVVPCDTTVDVLELLADLPAGYGPIGSKDEPARRYELRIEYAETATDLAAPYTSDDGMTTVCAPTRIREGYRFSACPVKDPAPKATTLLDELLAPAPVNDVLTDLIDRVEKARVAADALVAAAGQPKDATPPADAAAPPPAEQRRAIRDVLAEGRDWLLRNLSRPGPELVRMRLDPDDAVGLRDAAVTVLAALRQSGYDRICKNVNPPCSPCEDAAVSLAAITVRGCEITDVCIFVRRHVLSGPAVRHWLPIEGLYEALENICCGTGYGGDPAQAVHELAGGLAADPDSQRQLIQKLSAQVQKFETRLRKLEKGKGDG
jgi:hypothetical protein